VNSILKILLACICICFFTYAYAQKTIAITQIVSHEILDHVKQGIIDELQTQGFDQKTNHYIFENAQGNIATAFQIGNHLAGLKPDLIIAISTPSAQAALRSLKNSNIPMVFASVTDPLQAKLVNNLQHPGFNVTGTINAPPIHLQLALIQKILPNAKRIGMLLNYSELNSHIILEETLQQAKKINLTVYPVSVNNTAEVPTAVANLAKKVNVLFLIQDNTVTAALPVVIQKAKLFQIPIFAADEEGVRNGALASLTYNVYTIGRQTGNIAARILKGEKAGDIPVAKPMDLKLTLNMHTANALHIVIPENLIVEANEVIK
jgi:putative ABC transport system substrate-binding protein